MLEYDGISELLKAAPKRLDDARELLDEPRRAEIRHRGDASYRHLVGAVYLAGYAVECVLKAHIIEMADGQACKRGARVQRWSEALAHRLERGDVPDLGGRRSHNIELLLQATGIGDELQTDVKASACLAICAKRWRPALRYCPRHPFTREQAEDTVSAAERLHAWLCARLTIPL